MKKILLMFLLGFLSTNDIFTSSVLAAPKKKKKKIKKKGKIGKKRNNRKKGNKKRGNRRGRNRKRKSNISSFSPAAQPQQANAVISPPVAPLPQVDESKINFLENQIKNILKELELLKPEDIQNNKIKLEELSEKLEEFLKNKNNQSTEEILKNIDNKFNNIEKSLKNKDYQNNIQKIKNLINSRTIKNKENKQNFVQDDAVLIKDNKKLEFISSKKRS